MRREDRRLLPAVLGGAAGKQDPTGMNRCVEDRGKPLASASTLNRLELGNELGPAHYRKIQPRPEQIEQALLEAGVQTLFKEQQHDLFAMSKEHRLGYELDDRVEESLITGHAGVPLVIDCFAPAVQRR